jgi:hypothetical protein
VIPLIDIFDAAFGISVHFTESYEFADKFDIDVVLSKNFPFSKETVNLAGKLPFTTSLIII